MKLFHFKKRENDSSHSKTLQRMIIEEIWSRLKSMIRKFNESISVERLKYYYFLFHQKMKEKWF
jgi:hypothetical protein